MNPLIEILDQTQTHMERHVHIFLNRLSVIFFTVATLILISIFLQTPETCIPANSPIKPHHKFPRSTCDFRPRQFVSIEKRNKRLWSTDDWKKKVASYAGFFSDLGLLTDRSRVLCVSAGAGHEVMALADQGIKDVTGVELVEVPPLVSRADPHNLPFFDSVFDVAFSAHFDEALFPERYAREMERTVRGGGECVLAVEECSDEAAKEIAGLFGRSRFVGAANVSLIGLRKTRIVMKQTQDYRLYLSSWLSLKCS
uniref:Methyltransferase type 11 domain-containing protein n=1 Tax=Kalanchoe fedtschenkoi TaxID=63787 RepID=A0A7N0TL90_KALFE